MRRRRRKRRARRVWFAGSCQRCTNWVNKWKHPVRCVYCLQGSDEGLLPVSSGPITVPQAVPRSALDDTGELSFPQAVPGSALDDTLELSISQELLQKLLARDDLLSPRQHLQMYDSPLHISMDFGKTRGDDGLSHQNSSPRLTLCVLISEQDKLLEAAPSPQFNS